MAKKDIKSILKNRKGEKIGGDDLPTIAWAEGKVVDGVTMQEIEGTVVKVEVAETRHGRRTRLALDLGKPTRLAATMGEGEVETIEAKVWGVWLPARYGDVFRPIIGKRANLMRLLDGTQVTYDARAL